MSKPTPGPWVVAPSSNKHNGSGWRDIHSTSGPFAPSYVGEALEDDARLIAAAPDLLKALVIIANIDCATQREVRIAAIARAAISKAQGGAS